MNAPTDKTPPDPELRDTTRIRVATDDVAGFLREGRPTEFLGTFGREVLLFDDDGTDECRDTLLSVLVLLDFDTLMAMVQAQDFGPHDGPQVAARIAGQLNADLAAGRFQEQWDAQRDAFDAESARLEVELVRLRADRDQEMAQLRGVAAPLRRQHPEAWMAVGLALDQGGDELDFSVLVVLGECARVPLEDLERMPAEEIRARYRDVTRGPFGW